MVSHVALAPARGVRTAVSYPAPAPVWRRTRSFPRCSCACVVSDPQCPAVLLHLLVVWEVQCPTFLLRQHPQCPMLLLGPVTVYWALQCPSLLLRLSMDFLALSRSQLQSKMLPWQLLWLQHLFSAVMGSEVPRKSYREIPSCRRVASW